MSIFCNQEKSFNTVECNERINGIESMTSNTIAYFFKLADLNAVNLLLFEMFHCALRNKQLSDFLTVGGNVALVIDGTTCFESTVKHCDNCTEIKRNGVKYYQYRLLIASVVNIKTHDTVVVAIEPILNRDGSEKNDCEMNAAKRLLAKIKSMNSWMRYTVIADGLYTGAPIIEQIKSYNWEAIITLTDERMSIFKVADVRFGNRKYDFFYTEKLENNYLWFEEEPISDFWDAINVPIYIAKRRVEPIEKDGSIDLSKNKIGCFFISTIPLMKANIKAINKAHRARWGIENTTINDLKNRYLMKHIFVYRATAAVWAFASIAMNLFTIFQMRNRIVHDFRKMTNEILRKYIVTSLGGLYMFSNIFKLII